MTDRPLRIALLTHSTNPRGGVAHSLALGDALHDLGHHATVFAPDTTGRGFSRPARCGTTCVAAAATPGSLLELVEQRAAEYVAHFAREAAFDVYHAQDGISGNALATLAERGAIDGFVRTVHHLDDFADARVAALQDRSIAAAGNLFCVSELWAGQVRRLYGRDVSVVPNGVDAGHFSPDPTSRDDALRRRWGLGSGPVFVALGGVESRKNTLNILAAFARVRAAEPDAKLVIAGGASLLDHTGYRRRFADALAADAALSAAVILAGVLADDDVPALMRVADALVFPSVKEGFGLVVLEAMACGTPTVVSRIAPFTEYLADGDAAWCDPHDVASIASAMRLAVADGAAFGERGLAVAARFPWSASAERHLDLYHAFLQERSYARDEVPSALA